MKAALYSKDQGERNAFIAEFAAGAPGAVIHVYPKNMKERAARLPGVYSTTYEDFTKRDTWLHTNSLAGESASLILENPSRYPKATTPKSRALRRLSMQVGRKAIVDIVPFTVDIQYLYTPLSFLGREILGYAHNYAFRENYQEMGDDGVIRFAHDADVLAAKMKAACRVTYPAFLCPNRQVVEVISTAEEQERYAARKAELFEKEKNPRRIVTRLADTAHAFASRAEALIETVRTSNRPTLALCNLSSYATRLNSTLRSAGINHVKATSYQLGLTASGYLDVVYFESPIVNSYYLLDVEAGLRTDANVLHFVGDTKVDRLLFDQISHELKQIDDLTRELYAVTSGIKAGRPQMLPEQERPSSGRGTHCVGV